MSELISVFIWQWYDEKDKIDAVFSFCDTLTKLALSPEDKALTIPDCPFCELVNNYFSNKETILKKCCPGIGTELVISINELSELIENLSNQEAQCFSREIFWLPGWDKISNNAQQILELLDWETLSGSRSELQD
jgi:hypothetical protein